MGSGPMDQECGGLGAEHRGTTHRPRGPHEIACASPSCWAAPSGRRCRPGNLEVMLGSSYSHAGHHADAGSLLSAGKACPLTPAHMRQNNALFDSRCVFSYPTEHALQQDVREQMRHHSQLSKLLVTRIVIVFLGFDTRILQVADFRRDAES